jgi:protein TonB
MKTMALLRPATSPLAFAPDASTPVPASALAAPGQAARDAAITVAVLAVHAALLAVVAASPAPPRADVVIPAMVVSESVEAPAPKPEPVAPAPKPLPKPVPRTPWPKAAPAPVATDAPFAELASVAPPAEPAPVAARPSAVTATPASPRVELPSASAAYLDNPPPEYPRLSRRLNEQGRVVLRVLIGIDGAAAKAEIGTTSGYERLDAAALQAVLRWRYVPGRRNGVAEAMWFNVPVRFVLE